MDIQKDYKNGVFRRQELRFNVNSESTPSFAEIKQMVAKKFSKPEENIDVYEIQGNCGLKSFNVGADIYDSKEDLDKVAFLRKSNKQKKAEAEAKKKEEAEKEEETKKRAEEAKKEEKVQKEKAKGEETKKEAEDIKQEENKDSAEDAKQPSVEGSEQ